MQSSTEKNLETPIFAPVPQREADVIGLYTCSEHSSAENFDDINSSNSVRAPTPEGFEDIHPQTVENKDGNVEARKILEIGDGFLLEDVPHLTDFIPDLPVSFFLMFAFFLGGFFF